jgi:excisionase family DNA binding protein
VTAQAHPAGQVQATAPHGRVRLALSVTEAAEALGVSPDFFAEHIASELRIVRRGRRKLIAIRELEAWLDRSAARTLE